MRVLSTGWEPSFLPRCCDFPEDDVFLRDAELRLPDAEVFDDAR
jgi:hypothetical protein